MTRWDELRDKMSWQEIKTAFGLPGGTEEEVREEYHKFVIEVYSLGNLIEPPRALYWFMGACLVPVVIYLVYHWLLLT